MFLEAHHRECGIPDARCRRLESALAWFNSIYRKAIIRKKEEEQDNEVSDEPEDSDEPDDDEEVEDEPVNRKLGTCSYADTRARTHTYGIHTVATTGCVVPVPRVCLIASAALRVVFG